MFVKVNRMDTTGEGPVVVGVADVFDSVDAPDAVGAQFKLMLEAEEREYNEVWLVNADNDEPIAKALCTA